MDTQLRTQVRMPAVLAEWLKRSAEQNFRSMNGELVAILKERMDAQKENASVAGHN